MGKLDQLENNFACLRKPGMEHYSYRLKFLNGIALIEMFLSVLVCLPNFIRAH